MLASHAWLEELIGARLAPDEVARRLTHAGIEVEAMERRGEGLERVVVAQVLAARAHPERERLTLVTVDDGSGPQEIVCGAPNVPEPGGLLALAQLGARLPTGLEIAERKLAGVLSRGMLCGETELGVGPDDSGLLWLEPGCAAPGTPLADALRLRDTIYTLGLTPNRPDCLGHVGLARELCALFALPFRFPEPSAGARMREAPAAVLEPRASQIVLAGGHDVDASAALPSVRVEIGAPERCPRYGAAIVSEVSIGRSPLAVRYRLHTLGLRPISNVVDATNLVLLLWGHPIHAFDLAQLRSGLVRVQLAHAGERMTTLDGVERVLCADDLLIRDGERPIALAGVMGGAGSEISERTQNVLIECAYFDPRGVRRTSKRTGLHTDSSHRFERGVDPDGVPRVLGYAAALIAQLGGGVAARRALDCVALPLPRPSIRLRRKRVAALLGTAIEDVEIERNLRALGCTLERAADGYVASAPGHRPDLGREVDLIEELARLHGYDALPSALPAIAASEQGAVARIGLLRRAREAAAAGGLREAINYAFVAPRDLELVLAPPASVQIVNPMSEERSVLRTALLPGLLQNLRLAQSTQQRSVALFELGRVFGPSQDGALPSEAHELAIVLWGERVSWYQEGERYDFYDAKGMLSAIVAALGGGLLETVEPDALGRDAALLHPRRSARLRLAGQAIGELGELHPAVVQAHGLEGRPVYARIEIALLEQALGRVERARVRPLPRFPSATRDLAVVVPETQPALEVARALQEAAGPLAEHVGLFDIYRGEPVPAGHKSLAFHVVYRDAAATLTDKAVDEAHGRVQHAAQARFGAQLRG